MPNWVYDLPSLQLAGMMSGLSVGLMWFGIIFLKPFFRLLFRNQADANSVVGNTLSSYSVFYGLLLGLISVATYQNFSSLSDNISRESSTVAVLYRDFSSYDAPMREALQDRMRAYVRATIDDDWPLQRKGVVPSAGSDKVTDLYEKLTSYEPTRVSQQILHGQTLREFGNFIEVRRIRLANITGGIPGALWYVVLMGAALNLLLFLMFDMRFLVHVLLGGIVAFFLGVVFFIIISLDTPFRGDVSVGPDPFEAVYDSLMKPAASGK
jgi:hypothetical protein